MVLDTSAVMAILQQEADAPDLARRIAGSDTLLMSAPSVLEAGMLAGSRRGEPGAPTRGPSSIGTRETKILGNARRALLDLLNQRLRIPAQRKRRSEDRHSERKLATGQLRRSNELLRYLFQR